MKVGYARVSTLDQDEDAQIARLKEAGCEKILIDHGVSGMKASRPEWDKLIDPDNGLLRQGDILVFTKLDRIGRSLKHLLQISEDCEARGIDLVALDQAIDTTTATGKLLFHIVAAFAEFERTLISERTKDALAVRTARGRSGGRKPKLTPEQQAEVRRLYALTDEDKRHLYSGKALAELFSVSKDTIYAALNPARRDRVAARRRDRYARSKEQK